MNALVFKGMRGDINSRFVDLLLLNMFVFQKKFTRLILASFFSFFLFLVHGKTQTNKSTDASWHEFPVNGRIF